MNRLDPPFQLTCTNHFSLKPGKFFLHNPGGDRSAVRPTDIACNSVAAVLSASLRNRQKSAPVCCSRGQSRPANAEQQCKKSPKNRLQLNNLIFIMAKTVDCFTTFAKCLAATGSPWITEWRPKRSICGLIPESASQFTVTASVGYSFVYSELNSIHRILCFLLACATHACNQTKWTKVIVQKFDNHHFPTPQDHLSPPASSPHFMGRLFEIPNRPH